MASLGMLVWNRIKIIGVSVWKLYFLTDPLNFFQMEPVVQEIIDWIVKIIANQGKIPKIKNIDVRATSQKYEKWKKKLNSNQNLPRQVKNPRNIKNGQK